MAKLIYSRKALSDIEALTDFLSASDPGAAAETAGLICEAVDLLGKHPLIGRSIEHGLRELVISRGEPATSRSTASARQRMPS